MSIEQKRIEAEQLEQLRIQLLKNTVRFTKAPSEELYWTVSNLLGEYGEMYAHHHQLDSDELDSLSTTIGAGIELPDNVVPFRK